MPFIYCITFFVYRAWGLLAIICAVFLYEFATFINGSEIIINANELQFIFLLDVVGKLVEPYVSLWSKWSFITIGCRGIRMWYYDNCKGEGVRCHYVGGWRAWKNASWLSGVGLTFTTFYRAQRVRPHV